MAAMAEYHEELEKAGVLLDASGLQPSRKGWRIRYAGAKCFAGALACAEAGVKRE